MTYDDTDGEFISDTIQKSNYDIKSNFEKLSARYKENIEFKINESILKEISRKKPSEHVQKQQKTIRFMGSIDRSSVCNIKNMQQLDIILSNILEGLSKIDYYIKETHDYVMALPSSYWEFGSYNKWIRVGSLKNTDEKCFLTWIKFSAQSPQFKFDDISDLYDRWSKFKFNNDEG